MPFHREYPVRTYQSLVKDLQARAKKERKPQKRNLPKDYVPWHEIYEELMELTLRELEEIAEKERADIPEWDGYRMKSKYARAIIEARKRKLRRIGYDV